MAQIVPALLPIGLVGDIDIVALSKDGSAIIVVHDGEFLAVFLQIVYRQIVVVNFEEEGLSLLVLFVAEHLVLFPFAWRESPKESVRCRAGDQNSVLLAIAEFVEVCGLEPVL